MGNNEGKKGSMERLIKENRKPSFIWRRSRKRNIPQTEESPLPYDPRIPHEDDCLMQED